MQYIDNIAIHARLYGGWNRQVARDWVVGVEADFAYANEIAVFHGSPYPANLLFGTPSIERPFGATYIDDVQASRRPGMPASACAAVGSPTRRR